MSGQNRREFKWQTPLLAVACTVMMTGLASCSGGGWRQMIGLDQPPPDEFAVESRAPLTVPPDFDLRPPKPGAPRPDEVTAAEKAQQIINAAGPGSPGDQASDALLPESLPSQVDPARQVAPNSLASKLLSSNDSSAGGTVDSRETGPLAGVH
jgi:hypothetical protein